MAADVDALGAVSNGGPEKVFPLKWPRGQGVIEASSYELRFAMAGVSARGGTAMRISGGRARGITLKVPKGDAVRPATDGMRQAVFSSLGERIAGAWFLDLFAGSGAYGLEAMSRGAAGGVFVEKNAKAAACVRENIGAVCRSLGREPTGLSVLQMDATQVPLPAAGDARPDIVFVDPPYEMIGDIAAPLFRRLADALTPRPEALVVFELPGELELAPEGWTLLKRLGKGARQPTVAFFRRG